MHKIQSFRFWRPQTTRRTAVVQHPTHKQESPRALAALKFLQSEENQHVYEQVCLYNATAKSRGLAKLTKFNPVSKRSWRSLSRVFQVQVEYFGGPDSSSLINPPKFGEGSIQFNKLQ